MMTGPTSLISSSIYRALVFLCLTLAGCQQVTQPRTVSAKENLPALPDYKLPIPAGREIDDLARFIAGMPGAEGSAFKAAEETPGWVRHAADSDRGWKRFLTQRQPKMREFAKDRLSQKPAAQPTLFYPFGGPDIMTAQSLFPNASTYVLVGLEPPGSLPDPEMLRDSVNSYLPRLRASLGSILSKSFFVTREMDRQLRGQAADGLLPVMLIELVRNGNTIRGMRYISLDADGKWIERTVEGRQRRGKTDGVAVEFADLAGAVHQLAYFSVNLHNSKYKDNTAFHRHLERMGDISVMFKSTSYMTHRDDFDLIRTQVLSRAAAVVQDDSGIPYRFFAPEGWQVTLYGHYEQPYGSFRYLKQEDLRQAYIDRQTPDDLPFSIGYGFGRVKSNLLVAKKKN